MYVIVETSDSCDPIIYGMYKTKETAEKARKNKYKRFSERDWRNETILTITKIKES